MSMNDLQQAFELIEEHSDDADFDGPKDERVVAAAEDALGLIFPPTYRTFLLRLGCGGISGFEFYGVINADFENSGIPDAIWFTLRERVDSQLPQSLVLIAETGEGGYYALDTSDTLDDGECSVVEWVPGASDPPIQKISTDYGRFFRDQIASAVT